MACSGFGNFRNGKPSMWRGGFGLLWRRSFRVLHGEALVLSLMLFLFARVNRAIDTTLYEDTVDGLRQGRKAPEPIAIRILAAGSCQCCTWGRGLECKRAMEELQTRHRKEQRDLQSQVTQRKKQASKKTRKAVNDECESLEAELKEKQAREIAVLQGDTVERDDEVPAEQLEDLTLKVDGEADVNDARAEGLQPVAEQQSTSQQPGKKRNRQKDRLAKRAAEQEELARQAEEEAQNLPDLKDQERQRMLEAMKQHNLVEKEIRADGHCLYSAVADQLEQVGIPIADAPNEKPTIAYKAVRARAADYIAAHQDDFEPFLEEPLSDYLHKIRDTGEWGGQLELLALAKTYGIAINVLQDFGRVNSIENGSHGEKVIWLGYYKHGFGLGEHYNSLRKET